MAKKHRRSRRRRHLGVDSGVGSPARGHRRGHRRGRGVRGFERAYYPTTISDAWGGSSPSIFGEFGDSSAAAAVSRVFAADTLKGVGAASIGWVAGKALGGVFAKLKLTPKLARLVGAVGGAVAGSIAGNVIFKSAEIGDMAAVGNLLIAVDSIAGDPVNKALKLSGLGYTDGLGQVFLPEEVEMKGVDEGVGVFLPEETEIRGELGEFAEEDENVVSEDELEGVDEGGNW